MSDTDLDKHIPAMVNAWARTQLAAPRDLASLAIRNEVRDEVIERVFTHVLRRDVAETRVPTRENRSTHPRLDPNEIDPFAYTTEQLKIESEYTCQCGICRASGSVMCGECQGSGKSRCRECRGSGKVRSEKTGRPINCKHCRGDGIARCDECEGQRNVVCGECHGSGHQLAWLTFTQHDRFLVDITNTNSPTLAAHPRLRENRFLYDADLNAFTVQSKLDADGQLDASKLSSACADFARQHRGTVDRRLDRVQSQQALRLAVVRRDVEYSFCGTTGIVVLAGKDLSPTAGPNATRPMKRRLTLSLTFSFVLFIVGMLLRNAVVGSTAYFFNAQLITLVASLVLASAAFPVLMVVLRAWRGGTRFRPLGRNPKIALAALPGLLLVILVTGLVVRPSRDEVAEALKAGDVAAAREAVEALQDDPTRDPGILDAEDRVKLAEARKLTGTAQLALLDQVANRKGAASAEAKTTARSIRLANIRALVANSPIDALAVIERDFHATGDLEIREENALAHDALREACKTIACQLSESTAANDAHESAERRTNIALDRGKLVDALDTTKVADSKDLVAHLKGARAVMEAADATLDVINDADLAAKAKAAITWGTAERARVPVLNSPLPIVEELFNAKATQQSKAIARMDVDGLAVFASINGAARCSGLYVVGSAEGHVHRSSKWPAERVLASAFGHAVKIKDAKNLTATWYDSGFPIVARWSGGGDLVELRIGDASP